MCEIFSKQDQHTIPHLYVYKKQNQSATADSKKDPGGTDKTPEQKSVQEAITFVITHLICRRNRIYPKGHITDKDSAAIKTENQILVTFVKNDFCDVFHISNYNT